MSGLTLEQIHQKLVDDLKTMPWVLGQVYEYGDLRGIVPAPSVHIELTEFDDASMVGGGDALDISLRWMAHILVSADVGGAEKLVRQYALAVARQLKRLGCIGGGCGLIRIVRGAPNDFKEPLNGYVMWLVEFEFDAPIGGSDEEETPPMNPMTATIAGHHCRGDYEDVQVFTVGGDDE